MSPVHIKHITAQRSRCTSKSAKKLKLGNNYGIGLGLGIGLVFRFSDTQRHRCVFYMDHCESSCFRQLTSTTTNPPSPFIITLNLKWDRLFRYERTPPIAVGHLVRMRSVAISDLTISCPKSVKMRSALPLWDSHLRHTVEIFGAEAVNLLCRRIAYIFLTVYPCFALGVPLRSSVVRAVIYCLSNI